MKTLYPIEFRDFDRIVESFFRAPYVDSPSYERSYEFDETKDHFFISFDMPGVGKENIKIEVKENQLSISGERLASFKNARGESQENQARSYGQFAKTLSLPTNIDAEKIEAQYENGVLSLVLPKVESAKPRLIEIQAGNEGGLLSKR